MSVAEIALFLQTKTNDYQQLLSADSLVAARRHDMHLRVFSADNCAAKQVEQLHGVLNSCDRPQVVVVSPVQETALRSLSQEAGRLGVGWVVLNRWSEELPALRREFPHLPIFSVTPDQYEIGRVQGRQFKRLLPDGGEVVYVRGTSGTSSAQRRFEGLQQELDGTNIEICTFEGDWSNESGQRAIRNWVEGSPRGDMPTLVVGAQNDSMAAGARKALSDEARRHNVFKVGRLFVTGCDGASSFGQRLVAKGMITATVLVPSVSGRALDEIASVLKGGPLPPEEIVLGVSSYPDLPDSLCEYRGLGSAFGNSLETLGQYANLNDVALLEGLQNGERAAQSAFFGSYQRMVTRVLMRILRNDSDVADALQDTFIRSFRGVPQVKDPLALRGWVLRVAESVAFDHLRRRHRQELTAPGSTSTSTVEVPVDDASFELRIAVRETYQVLDRLPQDERVAFVMRYVEGIELIKLADMAGVSLATIKRRLSRAETRFRSLARLQPGLAQWANCDEP